MKGAAAWQVEKSVLVHLQSNSKDTAIDMHMDQTCDYEYVLDCKANCNSTRVYIALSTRDIQARDFNTLQVHTHFMNAHDSTINELYASPTNPTRVLSASSDRTVKVWDSRASASKEQMIIRVAQEAWSIDANCGETLLAVGSNDAVYFYDVRRGGGTKLGEYGESHRDAVTRVKFHPMHQTHIVTASEDGIVCLFDCGIAEEEDAVLSILNVESAVSKFQFYGPKLDSVACLTSTETLDLWNLNTATRHAHFPTIRQTCADMNVPIDYLIDAFYHASELYVFGGDHQGSIQLLHIHEETITPIQTLQSGHKACVRCILPMHPVLFTGGEDARVCRWSTRTERLSNSEVLRQGSSSSTHRYSPY